MRNVLLHAQIDQLIHGDHDYIYIQLVGNISHFRQLFNFWHNSITAKTSKAHTHTQYTHTVTINKGAHEANSISVNYANHSLPQRVASLWQKSHVRVGVNLIMPTMESR